MVSENTQKLINKVFSFSLGVYLGIPTQIIVTGLI